MDSVARCTCAAPLHEVVALHWRLLLGPPTTDCQRSRPPRPLPRPPPLSSCPSSRRHRVQPCTHRCTRASREGCFPARDSPTGLAHVRFGALLQMEDDSHMSRQTPSCHHMCMCAGDLNASSVGGAEAVMCGLMPAACHTTVSEACTLGRHMPTATICNPTP